MKKAFVSVELEVVHFELVDIITASEYVETESGTVAESSTGVPLDTMGGFNGEELPFN